MSTERQASIDGTYLTTFYGGDKGVCLQITPHDAYIQVDKTGALRLARDLLNFINDSLPEKETDE